MLSSLTISKILAEATGDIFGGRITSLEYYRKERAVQVYIKSRRRFSVTLSFHPQRSGFFILPAGKAQLDTTEKYRPFAKEIWDSDIAAVRQIPNDRLVEIVLNKNRRRWVLLFEILGPNGNLWLLDENGYPFASLRAKTFDPGKPYQAPPLPSKIDPLHLDEDELKRLMQDNPDKDIIHLLEKKLYGFDAYMARTIAEKAGNPEDDDYPSELVRQIQNAVSGFTQKDTTVYTYRIRGRNYFYPFRLYGLEDIGKFKSTSEAQKKTVDTVRESNDAEDFRERTLKFITQKIIKTEKLLGKLEKDVATAADFEKYLQYSDLLKIHLDRLKRGLDSITVTNLFGNGETVTIKLDPKLDGPKNVEAYSRQYRKGREGLSILQRRRDNTLREIEHLREVQKIFEGDFERACHEFPEFLPREKTAGTPALAVSRPYREFQTSTGLTVLVGKNGENNDRTTFEYARPYELWFHTSQCPGSHVVMKFPHKNFEPSAREIEETAAMAAYHSKARGSTKVPVSYTLKKYVRKPRRAKSGLVTIERETTIMVEPRELQTKSD